MGNVPHFCYRGGTVHPALLAGPLAGLVWVFVRDRTIAWLAVGTLGFLGFILCFWGTEVVHQSPYVGNPEWPERMRRNAELARRNIAASMVKSAPPDLVLPQGWIEELWERVAGDESLPSGLAWVEQGELGWFWHTGFTGLYRLDEYDTGFWCSGGPVAECARKLEVRRR